jgi:hypothetical protein
MDLFRKSALQRMLSPEQLDQLIQITKPRDWIALLGICGILIALIIWSIFGSITIDIQGQGILIKPGGYLIVESPIEGQITKIIQPQAGEIINNGQVVAEVSQPLLQLKIAAAEKLLSQLEQQEKNNPDVQAKIAQTKSQLALLKDEWQINTKIRSPYTGSFLAMRTGTGIYIRPGDSILSMENSAGKIIAVVFLPPTTTDINTIKPGMLTKIFIGLEKNSESGYLIGRVNHVSRFPASPQVMTAILNNDYLVKFFSQDGPPYLVYIDLIPDSHSVSGYKWSSIVDRKINIMSGTLCSALVEVASKPPINFVIPNVKKSKE